MLDDARVLGARLKLRRDETLHPIVEGDRLKSLQVSLDELRGSCAAQNKLPEAEVRGLDTKVKRLQETRDGFQHRLSLSRLGRGQALGIVVDASFCEFHEMGLVKDGRIHMNVGEKTLVARQPDTASGFSGVVSSGFHLMER